MVSKAKDEGKSKVKKKVSSTKKGTETTKKASTPIKNKFDEVKVEKKVSTKTNSAKKEINILSDITFENGKYDWVFLAVFLILVVIYLISPRVYSVTTARYGQGTKEDNRNVEVAMGTENTEERFLTYFQWYNVIHELGHGLKAYNSNLKLGHAETEQLVNDFAVAYWMYYGEEEKLELLQDIVDYATEHIEKPELGNLTYIEYANKHWSEDDFMAFNGYGWFQFTSTKESLKNKKSLEEVLEEMRIKDYKLTDKKLLEYPEINEEVCTQIINDAVDNIRDWGLKYYDVKHHYSNNPNSNFSGPSKMIFVFFDFVDFRYTFKL